MTPVDPTVDPAVAAYTARRRERAARHHARVAAAREPVVRRPLVRIPRRRRMLAFAALGMAACTALTGCSGLSGGLYDVPLPGGADLGDTPLTIHVRMADVYDLVPQAAVKLGDVTVGKVTGIDLANPQHGHWQADVTVEANSRETNLPANALAELRQTSLLGEKYVELLRPQHPSGQLASGAVLTENPGYTHVEVEQVLGALSLLLNDGGLPQVRTIAQELNSALSGHESDVRGLLGNLNTLTGNLDAHSSDITRALDGLDRLSATLNGQKNTLASAIDNLTPGLRTLRDQRSQLVGMLRSLQNLSGVAIDTVNRSRDDIIADLRALLPTVKQLAATGDNLANSLQLLVTIPFSDYAAQTARGDYENLYANLDLNVGTIIQNLGRSRQEPLGQLGVIPPPLARLIGGGQSSQPGQPDASTGSGSQATTNPAPPPPQQSPPPPGSPAQPLAPLFGQPDSGGGGLGGIFGTLSGGGA